MNEQSEEKKLSLGFGSSPDELTFVFIGGDENDTSGSCWYTRDFDAGINHPIESRAITGFINRLLISKSIFKKQTNYKLNIRLTADKRYSIRAGINTMFSRGFLLAFEKFLNDGNDPKKIPITIAVRQGEDNKVVFCALFDTATNTKIFVDWDRDRDLIELTQELQTELGMEAQTMDMINNPENYRQERDQPSLREQRSVEDGDYTGPAKTPDEMADEIFGPAKEDPDLPKARTRTRRKK